MITKKIFAAIAIALAAVTTANAGGMLTNTNQSVAFLRNPARDAAIGIDGVYSNPAGVAFLKDGWHVGVNWQCAVQTRAVTTTSPYLDHTLSTMNQVAARIKAGESLDGINIPSQRYRGHATAPFIPSVSAAYNHKKWSFQFHFAISGGGGKCQYENGLGDFESQVGKIAYSLQELGVKGCGVDGYMEGSQYYYGITLGAAYKINDHISVYAGIRGLIASASYNAQLKNITVATSDGLHYLSDFVNSTDAKLTTVIDTYNKYGQYYDALKQAQEAGTVAQGFTAEQQAQIIQAVDNYPNAVRGKAGLALIDDDIVKNNGMDLSCDQSGFGIAPILAVDWKLNKHFNFALKYEFRTVMNLHNSSDLEKASMAATAQYVNGLTVREDSPALLTFGAQYTPIDMVRVNFGYHHYFDTDAKKTYFYMADPTSLTSEIVRSDNKNDLLAHGTDEFLGGVEVDCTDRLTVSGGFQATQYGNTDKYMSDQSFVVNSWSFGFGASYQANPNVRIEAAYFKTIYGNYTTAPDTFGQTSTFTRTNDVIGVGLVMNF